MPTTRIEGPYRFFFYSREPNEPRHTHVKRNSSEAKFWLDPINLAYNYGFSQKEIREIERIVNRNADLLRRKWDEFFGQ
jgi:hypothetical protein